ncbi:phage shock protein PspC (stress-responsive transcriptional regulator) [Flavobacterium endophyticum]|uniref:Phage shock protein PspC (Stress-responsive transcriptional regulator) n=1 Tax=Flavobacterium endophyticum TaxID=1540163 RepID=A0A495MJC7_9FLAO|nr:PspC domain-containing protein [Flavobacterium endophyticum]RKS25528.1 phage shock protein PspC (stress-responsive transcriptional regulator) [Flavobacterium endophyticum]
MNKTVNINLGGMFFHIDEDAYQKLNRYFDAVKRSLSNSTGKDEIMKDIEMRIAELLTEKNRGDKQVVGIKDVEEVITVMGQPEDYRIDDDGAPEPSYNYSTSAKKSRKLYRDKDNAMVGGVLSGFGHYLGIDALWLRIIMVILLLGFGTGFLIYVILWILMPAANTTTEKLEMTGEPVTISNIERKVREEFENISDKFKNVDYDKMGNQVRSTGEKIGSSLSDVILKIFSILGKVIGAFLVVFASATLGSLIIGVITAGSISMVDFPWQSYIDNFTDVPLWIVGMLILAAIGIPFFFLLILGLKLLITNMKSIGNPAKYTLLALWIISIGALTALGLQQATEVAFDAKVVQKQKIDLNPNDTLKIKFTYNDYYAKSIYDTEDFEFVQDSTNTLLIYSNNVSLRIMKTDEKTPYLQIEKKAEGKSFAVARQRAEKIKYNFKIEGNQLILDNYLLTDIKNKYRNQEVEIFLYLPEGTYFKPDMSVQNYDHTDDGFFNLWFDSDIYVYKMEASQVKCLNCPPEAGEGAGEEVAYGVGAEDMNIEANDSTSTTVTINEKGVQIKEGANAQQNKKVKGLKIDKDGVIIKTN